jgi:hypothetical protein
MLRPAGRVLKAGKLREDEPRRTVLEHASDLQVICMTIHDIHPTQKRAERVHTRAVYFKRGVAGAGMAG